MQQDYLQIRVLELAPLVYVSKQLFEHDVRLLAKQGVRSLMDNRPADEAMEQPLSTDLALVAEELGMTFVHFPVDPKSITNEELEAFTKCCGELERPLLLFSRTGAGSTKIWEASESM